MSVWYCTREDVTSALDSKVTARSNAQIDRLIAASTDAIHGITHRRFYPELGTRYFDWPDFHGTSDSSTWTLWLDGDEIISLSAVASGGTVIDSGEYFLEPGNEGPPFTSLELNRSLNAAFNAGPTDQRSIVLTGTFGYSVDDQPAGTVVTTVMAADTVTLDVSDSAAIGVGQILRIGTERLLVTGKGMLDSGQTLGITMASNPGVVTVAVTDGTQFQVNEVILIGGERMLVVDIAGNNLIVKRSWDGSVLADHLTLAPIFVARRLTVSRAALGTTAAVHVAGAPILKHCPPNLIRQLAIALTIDALQQEGSGYARTVGSGEGTRNATGAGLEALVKRVKSSRLTRHIRALGVF